MQSISLEHAQTHLAEVIARLQPGEEVDITRNEQPVAKIVAAGEPSLQPRKAGSAKGTVLYIAEDFDAPLEDFREYME